MGRKRSPGGEKVRKGARQSRVEIVRVPAEKLENWKLCVSLEKWLINEIKIARGVISTWKLENPAKAGEKKKEWREGGGKSDLLCVPGKIFWQKNMI